MCMIMYFILEETFFVVIIYKLLVQKKILKCHVKNCLKIHGKQMINMPKKDEYVRFKNHEKNKISIYDLCRF